jgi:hypothetical protein
MPSEHVFSEIHTRARGTILEPTEMTGAKLTNQSVDSINARGAMLIKPMQHKINQPIMGTSTVG